MARLPTDIKALARVHTETALHTLAKIMTTEDAPAAARVAAAQALLARGWGQPQQSVEISGEITSKVIRTPMISPDNSAWLKQHGDQNASQEIH
jgi:hypothetical protein